MPRCGDRRSLVQCADGKFRSVLVARDCAAEQAPPELEQPTVSPAVEIELPMVKQVIQTELVVAGKHIEHAPGVLIVMPVMDRLELLQRTLPALLQYTDREWCHLYVVANGSGPETLEFVRYMLSGQRNRHLIVNERNIGYAQAVSQGFALRPEGFHTIHMDDDVLLLKDGVVEQLVKFVESGNGIGMVNPYGFNTNWTAKPMDLDGIGKFIDTGYVYTTFALIAEWVHKEFGASWQPGLYGFEDYITSRRVVHLGYHVGYWVPDCPVYEHLGVNDDEGYTKFKLRQRTQSYRAERERTGKKLDTVWMDGKDCQLFFPLPDKNDIPVEF